MIGASRPPQAIGVASLPRCARPTSPHHAINGKHGFEARSELIERSAVLEFEIKSLEAVRARLERDVASAFAEPDPDLVEELASEVLGFVRPRRSVVLTLPPTPRVAGGTYAFAGSSAAPSGHRRLLL